MTANPLATRIAGGAPVLAVNLGGYAPALIALLTREGADCLFIDCETAPLPAGEIRLLADRARAAGLATVLRAASAEPALLDGYLACGVDGLVVPEVESAATCDAIVAAADRASRRPFLIAQIESVAGRTNMAAIAGRAGIDLILIGPNDLSRSMGLDGDTARPELIAALSEIAEGVRALGKPYGLPVTEATAAEWIGRSARFLYTDIGQFAGPPLRALRARVDASARTPR